MKETKLKQIEILVQEIMLKHERNDASWNGLQIENDGVIKQIFGGVDATLDFFNAASCPDHALFLVHHGVYWKHTDPRTIGVMKEKIQFCFSHQAALMAYHLPLDVHPELGNNSQILQKLGFQLSSLEPFGHKDGVNYGFLATREKTIKAEDIFCLSKEIFSHDSIFLKYGKEKIKTCAVVSGSGGFSIQEAFEKKIDLFVTGEYSHSAYTFARDHDVNLLCLTHYGSEKEGVISLGREIEKKLAIKFTFLDILPIF